MLKAIENVEQYQQVADKENFYILAFYSDASEKSKQAINVLDDLKNDNSDTPFYSVNASTVKDIHPRLGVNSVPTVLAVKDGKIVKNIQGLQNRNHYEMLLYDAPVKKDGTAKPRHSVTVYSTPTCSWCNRLKQHLRQHRVMFRDVDVSRDQHAAQELMRRTGQTGVPQTDIDGQIIVGFDQTRIDSLLGLAK